MWYLIVPPIIIVVSLSFVLWYLSRKSADPLIAEKASRLVEETREQISFLRTKNFFLRILEKTAYRFKVVSLQTHNGLHNLTQTLKARRRRFQDGLLAKKSKESSEQPKISEQTSDFRRPSSIGAVLGKPVFHQSNPGKALGEDRPVQATHEPASPPLPAFLRPMVSETMTHPETGRERTQADIAREENLIARIAGNPKDFTAYEGLGDYYLEIGNIKDAKECYRQVLKLSPVHRIVRIKIRRLEKLLGQ